MNAHSKQSRTKYRISITKYAVYDKWTLVGSFDTIQDAVYWIEKTFRPSVQSKLVLMQESYNV